jgi:hypothetical protein
MDIEELYFKTVIVDEIAEKSLAYLVEHYMNDENEDALVSYLLIQTHKALLEAEERGEDLSLKDHIKNFLKRRRKKNES